MKNKLFLPPVLFGAGSILLFWQFILPKLGVPAYVLPTPSAIAMVMWQTFDVLKDNFFPTSIEALAGFLIGNTLACGIAAVFVHSRFLKAAYFPLVLLFNTIPVLALSPIIIMIFGLGLAPKIIIAAIVCFFPTLVNMLHGLESATSNEHELFRILCATKTEVFWRLRVPNSIPMLFSSLRIASTTAVVGAVVGEWVGSDKGLGALIIQASFNYQSDRLFAALVLCAALAIILYGLVVLLENTVTKKPK